MMRKKLSRTAFIGALVVVGVAGYVMGKARANGIPETGTLAYSGVLEDANSQPVTAVIPMTFQLFDAQSAGTLICQTALNQQIQVTDGRFSIELPKQCVDGVKQNRDAWVALTVGTEALPRTKLRAVPYAIEAASAGRVVVSNESKSISVGALFCGATSQTYTGNLGGLAAAKSVCETTCGDPVAHMCTDEEIRRSTAIGISMNPSSYWAWAAGQAGEPTNYQNSDCNGWTEAAGAGSFGTAADNKGRMVAYKCDSLFSIACCK